MRSPAARSPARATTPAAPWSRPDPAGSSRRLTPLPTRPYHPPDDDAPSRLTGARRVCVPLGVTERSGSRGRMERITDSPDEADVPAQEAPSRQGARLPRPHEDAGRAARAGRSAGSGSEAAVGLTERARSQPAAARDALPPAGLRGGPGGGTDTVPPAARPRRFLRTDLDDDPVRPRDRRAARRGRRPEPRPAPAPRGAQGDGALVPARLGRPHHRPARDRRGRPRRTGRGIAPGPPIGEACSEGRRAGRSKRDRDRVDPRSTGSCSPGCRRAAGSSRRARATPSRRSRSTGCCRAAGWAPSASPAATLEPGRLRPGPLTDGRRPRDALAHPPGRPSLPASPASLLVVGACIAARRRRASRARRRRGPDASPTPPAPPLAPASPGANPIEPARVAVHADLPGAVHHPGRGLRVPQTSGPGQHRDRDHPADARHPGRRSSRSTAGSSSRQRRMQLLQPELKELQRGTRATAVKSRRRPAGVLHASAASTRWPAACRSCSSSCC